MANIQPLQPTLWRTCRVLANRTRLQMLSLLCKHPGLTVSGVAQRLDLDPSLASLYLRALEARGLLSVRRRGRWVYYRLSPEDSGTPAALLVAALRRVFQQEPCLTERVFELATAFTHPRRIEVFRALLQQPRNIQQLQAATRIPAWALRRHLRKLERRGFIAQQPRNLFVAVQGEGALGRSLARLAVE